MDLNSIVRFIYTNHEIMLGVTITLFLAVTVLVLGRSIMEDRRDSVSDMGVDAIERTVQKAVAGAVKTVFAEGGNITGREGQGLDGATDGEMSPREVMSLKESLLERESRIESLMKDIESLKTSANMSASAEKAKGASEEEFNSLKQKLKELQTKLSEYEIIEDDIADLSMYKEENNKLKTEIDTLKAVLETAKNQVQSVNKVVSRSGDQTPAGDVQAAGSTSVEISVNTDDNVMSEFAKSLEKNETIEPQGRDLVSSSDLPIEDPQAAVDALLADSMRGVGSESKSVEGVNEVPEIAVDSTKLQVEVEKLAEQMASAEPTSSSGEEEPSILDEKLDTDRLLQEMSASEKESVPETELASTPTPTPTTPVDKPVPATTVTAAPSTIVKPVDDLLAEFEDTEFNNEKESKG